MKTATGAAIVALSVLVLGAAPAGAAGGARARPCAGDQPPPKMTTNIHTRNQYGEYLATYGEKLVIHCSGDDISNISMKVNGRTIHAVTINKTTIQLKIYKSDFCTDSGTGCKDSSTVVVLPTMSVYSPRAQHQLHYGGLHYYFVPHDEEYQVLCSGPDSTAFSLIDDEDNELQTGFINSTTLIYEARADYVEELVVYRCRGKGNTVDGEEDVLNELTVTMDFYPQSEHFRCVIDDWPVHVWHILECTWRYPTDTFSFSLFYTDHNDDTKGATLLCERLPGELNMTCRKNIHAKGHKMFTLNQNITLLLTTCYETYCYNETFNYNTNSLIKPEWNWAPGVINTSSYDAVLNLYSARYLYSMSVRTRIFCDTCVYRVKFRLNSTTDVWRQADTSSVRCMMGINHLVPFQCHFRLALPYPDTEYEVRVYTRHRDSVDDRLWSDPRSIHVRTEPRAPCACNAAPHTPATVSPEAASCEACAHTEDAIKRNLALKNKIKSMQKKRTTIIKISKLLSNIHEVEKELNYNKKR